MRVSILQTNIVWEDKETNLKHLQSKLEELCGKTDLAILPEMFSTGFSMRSKELAEPVDGETITTLRSFAKAYNIALAGSYIASDSGSYYNRAFFITPQEEAYYYDKRHLFRMGNEHDHFSAGDKRLIVSYLGWNICLLVCYDLRFPVWSRNVNNEYDLLIYVANWPTARRPVWDTLLSARAIENMTYVCGVNRVGIDGSGFPHNGGSAIYSARGNAIAQATDDQEDVVTLRLSLEQQNNLRKRFPAWADADEFSLTC